MSNRPCLNLPHCQYHNVVGCWINCMSTLCAYYNVYIIHIVDIEILYNTNSNMGTSRSIAMSAILIYENDTIENYFCSISYLCQHYDVYNWGCLLCPIVSNIINTDNAFHVGLYQTSSTLIMPSMPDCIKHHQHW